MGIRYRRATALVLSLVLAGCTTPRGAGFESEVLAASKVPDPNAPDGQKVADFTVHPVTRDSLAALAGWPATGLRSYSWIPRREQPASMIIAPGDSVNVHVWDTEDNSLLAGPGERVANLQNVRVSPSGSVFLPFVGEMKISGMAPETARARIEERFLSSIPSAQVQLSVAPGRENTANLVSGVANPGVYPLIDRNTTLLTLLAQGGGVQPSLKNPQIRLMRGSAIHGVSVQRLFEDPSLDTTLQGGDRVIVEEDKRYFLSLGAAGTEAMHLFPKDQVSALDAMSLMGGLEENTANPKGILILREYPATAIRSDGSGPSQPRIVFSIDLTTADGLFSAGRFAIMPGDLVYATESRVTSARTVLGILGSVSGLTARF